MAGDIEPQSMRSCTVKGVRANFRIVSVGPVKASGGMMALTRDPSPRRASTSGDDSSIRRPTRDTMRSMTRRSWSSLVNVTGVRRRRPPASM